MENGIPLVWAVEVAYQAGKIMGCLFFVESHRVGQLIQRTLFQIRLDGFSSGVDNDSYCIHRRDKGYSWILSAYTRGSE